MHLSHQADPRCAMAMAMHINCLYLYLLHSCREVPVCFGNAADSISNRISSAFRLPSMRFDPVNCASPLSLKVNCTQCDAQTCNVALGAAFSCGNRISGWQRGIRTCPAKCLWQEGGDRRQPVEHAALTSSKMEPFISAAVTERWHRSRLRGRTRPGAADRSSKQAGQASQSICG